MALNLVKGPDPSVALARAQMPSGFLQKLRGQAGPGAALRAVRGRQAAQPGEFGPDVDLARPHPIYTASTVAFLKGTLLESARLSGWQYVLLLGERAFGTIELATTGGQLSYSGVYEGPYAEWLMEALSIAEQLPAVKQRDYQLRVLRAPTVLLYAVWLRSARNDLLIPLHNVPPPLQPNGVYTELQVTNALRPLAIQRTTVSDAETEIEP